MKTFYKDLIFKYKGVTKPNTYSKDHAKNYRDQFVFVRFIRFPDRCEYCREREGIQHSHRHGFMYFYTSGIEYYCRYRFFNYGQARMG